MPDDKWPCIVSCDEYWFAHVDLPNDMWSWAVVTYYKGPQEYEDVVFAFAEDFIPKSYDVVLGILQGLVAEWGGG